MTKGRVFVISGPSGSGKTTLRDALFREPKLKKILVKSISLTTRPKRSKEREGREYFFVSECNFQKQRSAKKILEWTKYLGYYYATPRGFVESRLKNNKSVILCLDLKGAMRLKRLYPRETVTIFIMPPSLEALRKRIEGRCHRTKRQEVFSRLKLAREELAAMSRYDYRLVNKNLTQAKEKLKKIILLKIRGR
jgi:guanylate kinase